MRLALALFIASCALWCVGCHTWAYSSPAEITALRASGPVRARVTTEEGSVVIDDARIVAGKIVGSPAGRVPDGVEVWTGDARIDLRSVSTIEVLKGDDTKSGLLVLGILLATAAVAGIVLLGFAAIGGAHM